jgi:DNA replication and repair protein RecF
MKIKRIKLTNFRNYQNLDLKLSESINIFHGNNGQGKTNLVEAIYFNSLLKSFREDEVKPLIRIGEESGLIELEALVNEQRTKFKIVLTKNSKKMFINNKEIKKNSDFIGHLNVVSFIPKDVFLFQASPKERRDFIDDEIVKLSPAYALAISDLAKMVKERNEAFKQKKLDEVLIDVINRQIAKLSVEVLKKRYKFIKSLNQEVSNIFEKIIGSKAKLQINYQSFIEEANITEKNILEKLLEKQKDDIQRQTTSVGTHRDDYAAALNEQNIALYGSQGQQRLAVIAIKLALINLIYKQIGDQPIVVLDDVLSELDLERQTNVISFFKNQNQLFVTTANLNKKVLALKEEIESTIYSVDAGNVSKE